MSFQIKKSQNHDFDYKTELEDMDRDIQMSEHYLKTAKAYQAALRNVGENITRPVAQRLRNKFDDARANMKFDSIN